MPPDAAVKTDEALRTDPGRLKAFAASVLSGLGVPEEKAATTAGLMVDCDVRGVHTHGIRYLPVYVPLLQGGGMRAGAEPKVVRDTTASAVVDGDAAMGHIAAHMATQIAIEKAQANGVMSTVLVRNSNHFGANGSYALMLAEAGLIGLVLSNAVPVMSAPGSRKSILSNAPTAYAVPTSDGGGPLLFDAALSTIAGSRAVMARDRGESLAPGLVVDGEGQPSTDPSAFLDGGSLTPIGAHKGYALALLVEILTGVLSGAGITQQVLMYPEFPNDPTNTGHAIIAWNIEAFMARDEFDARIAGLRSEIHDAPKADGVDRLLLPGELEAAHIEESTANGLELDAVTWAELTGVAEEFGQVDALEAARR